MTFNLYETVTRSTAQAAKTMQRDIRRSAIQHGWHPDVVNSLSVEHGDSGFEIKVDPKHAQAAFIHEYGSETQQPTAVIRKYDNYGARSAIHRNLSKNLRDE